MSGWRWILWTALWVGCGPAKTPATGDTAPTEAVGTPTTTLTTTTTTGTETTIGAIEITGTEYFVTQSGDDGNTCTNAGADACRTINRCLSLVVSAGDGCSVEEGTYLEDASASVYYPGDCQNSGLALYPFSVCTQAAGTVAEPMVLRAAPGHEGRVTIDSQTPANGNGGRSAMGINHDDWVVYGLRWVNNRNDAINGDSRGIRGVRIENNFFDNTLDCASGPNMAHVQYDQGVDWVVRNNYFGRGQWYNNSGDADCANAVEEPSHMTAIMAFKVENSLIENNHFAPETKVGVLWKSHFLPVVFESTIRYNLFDQLATGLNMICCGENKPGDNVYTQNVFRGTENWAVLINASGGDGDGGVQTISHNVFDSSEGSQVTADSTEVVLSGNLFYTPNASNTNLKMKDEGTSVDLSASENNVFISRFRFLIDDSSAFDTLADWQAIDASQFVTTSVVSPDLRSVMSELDVEFVDAAGGDYHLRPGASALGLMLDGSNAGPYRTGSEVIGLLPSYSAGYP